MSEEEKSKQNHCGWHSVDDEMLESRIFTLNPEDFKQFKGMLDRPPSDNPGLKALLNVKAPWSIKGN